MVPFIIRPNYDEDRPDCWSTSRKNSFERVLIQRFKACPYTFVTKIGTEQILKLSKEKKIYTYAFHK